MIEFGEVLTVIGEYGRFQKWLVVMMCIPNFLTPFHMFGQLFITMDTTHFCNTSWILAISPHLSQEQQWNLTIPRKPDGSFNECSMYTPVQKDPEIIINYGLNETEKCQDGWVYPDQKEPTLLTEFNLVCDQKNLKDISQSIYMGGLLAGAMIFGPLSDRIGSRRTILLTLLIMGLFGVGTGFAPYFSVYIILRFLVGAAFAGISISMAALNSEWVGASYRALALIITHCCNALGQMALSGLAYAISDWRRFQEVGSAPVLLLFFYIWVLPDSARWLLTKGKVKEAKKVIQRAASVNKRTIPPELFEQLTPEENPKSGSILDLFKKAHQRRMTLIMALVWFTDSLVYYGLSLQVEDFGLNIYLTQLVFGAVEIPARFSCIYLLQWLGRKKCQAGWLLLGGVVCSVIPAIPQDYPTIVTVLAVLGKSALAASFSTSYVFSAEVFPTVVRQTGLGLCSMSARIAGILSPLIGLLKEFHPAVPMALLGITSLTGGILCFFLPETRDKDLPDDMINPSRQGSVAAKNLCKAESECLPDDTIKPSRQGSVAAKNLCKAESECLPDDTIKPSRQGSVAAKNLCKAESECLPDDTIKPSRQGSVAAKNLCKAESEHLPDDTIKPSRQGSVAAKNLCKAESEHLPDDTIKPSRQGSIKDVSSRHEKSPTEKKEASQISEAENMTHF